MGSRMRRGEGVEGAWAIHETIVARPRSCGMATTGLAMGGWFKDTFLDRYT
jgi:hypothetical protein